MIKAAKSSNKMSDFIILGPTMNPGNRVLEAIHALYYLPKRFKLIFTGPAPLDRSFYNQMIDLIERDDLSDRVHFAAEISEPNAIILPHAKYSRAKNSIAGDSAEALASAILNLARA